MAVLSPFLEQLLDVGKAESLPSIADRERVLGRIRERLVLAGTSPPAATPKVDVGTGFGAAMLSATAITSLGVALIVAGVAIFQWLNTHSVDYDETRAESSVSNAFMMEAAPAERQTGNGPEAVDDAVAEVAKLGQRTTSMVSRTLPSSARVRDSLSDEVEILSRAERELFGGRAENALQMLNQHAQKYRNGKLTEERNEARVQALCALGRVKEASTYADQLATQSIHGDPRRPVCAPLKSDISTVR